MNFSTEQWCDRLQAGIDRLFDPFATLARLSAIPQGGGATPDSSIMRVGGPVAFWIDQFVS